MLNLRDKIIRGVLVLFLIAALCAGVAHLVDHQNQPEAGHYYLSMAIITAEDAAGSPGSIFGLHLNTGLPESPLSNCNPCISTSQDGRETSLPLSFLCELLC